MSGQQSSRSGSAAWSDEFGRSGTGTGMSSGGQGAGVEDVKEAAKQTAQETKDAAMQTAQEIKGDVQAQATEIAGEAKQQAGEMLGQAKEQATNAFTQQREQAVSGLGSLADALRNTAQSMKDSNDGAQAGIARFVDDAAERLSQSADFLRDKDTSQLLHDVQDFAKKQPLAFVGAAFGVGIIAARLLKGAGSGSQAIDQAMSSMSEQAVNAMDSVKERVAGATGSSASSDQGQGQNSAGSSSGTWMNETASDFEVSRSSGTTGQTGTGTSSMPTGATAGYAPEVEGTFGREGQS
jgi:ElaB/YqjD/DUF883 family membrane-anchored ribosome-binding protein